MVNSMLDNDMYKFMMQQAVLEKYSNADVVYKFTNRGQQRFTNRFITDLRLAIKDFEKLLLTQEEYDFIKNIPEVKPWYAEYLKSYRFNSSEVLVSLTDDNDLELTITGPWHSTILWEVPLMATISELFFKGKYASIDYNNFYTTTNNKIKDLKLSGITFVDFGTRRRESYYSQNLFVSEMKRNDISGKTFKGTSNVYLAMKYNINPIGTVAHEWIMGISALESIRYANRFALDKWFEVYQGRLGIALPDTFTTDVFLKDFDFKNANLYYGVRHDSGDPKFFIDKMIKRYNELGINYRTKTIIFSDGISSINEIEEIKQYCKYKGIKYSFGIGTWLTNDFPEDPLNMVIKLHSVNEIPVVKFSDTAGKITGDANMAALITKLFNY